MKTYAKITAILAVGAIMAHTASADAIVAFVQPPGSDTSQEGNSWDTRTDNALQAGFSFTANAVTINRLGTWVAPVGVTGGTTVNYGTGPGTLVSEHTVALYMIDADGSTSGTLIASATIAAGTVADTASQFAWAAITPITLTAGQRYAVTSTAGNGDRWTPGSFDANTTADTYFGTRHAGGIYSGSNAIPGTAGETGSWTRFGTGINTNGGFGYYGGNIGFINESTDPYASWDNGYAADLSDKNADLDGDGMSNFQEFAFGLNPTSGASVNPITNLATLKSAGTFNYTRLANSGLTYTVWASTDLVDWGTGPVAVTEEAGPVVDGVQTVVIEITTPPSGDKYFVRVAAE